MRIHNLTAAMLDHTPGEYQPLVTARAEKGARDIRPSVVVPFDWSPNTTRGLCAIAALVGMTFIPTFDLFGKEAERQEVAERIARLEVEKKIAATRAVDSRINSRTGSPFHKVT